MDSPRPEEVTWPRFDRLVAELVDSVRRSGFEAETIVGIAKGGVFVGGAVAERLACHFLPVRISRRSRDRQTRARPRIYGEMPKDVRGRRILVVDDVVASGQTLALAVELARGAGATEVKTAALVVHPDASRPDYAALESEALTVFPWDYEVIADGRFEQDPETSGA